MSASGRTSWLATPLLVGAAYCAIGVVFALPSSQGRAWRLAAWGVSALVYAAHIGYERLRLRSSSRATALHAALAAAVGAFGLAVAANVHEIWVGAGYRRILALALLAWPALVAVPAFVVALVAAVTLARIRE